MNLLTSLLKSRPHGARRIVTLETVLMSITVMLALVIIGEVLWLTR